MLMIAIRFMILLPDSESTPQRLRRTPVIIGVLRPGQSLRTVNPKQQVRNVDCRTLTLRVNIASPDIARARFEREENGLVGRFGVGQVPGRS